MRDPGARGGIERGLRRGPHVLPGRGGPRVERPDAEGERKEEEQERGESGRDRARDPLEDEEPARAGGDGDDEEQERAEGDRERGFECSGVCEESAPRIEPRLDSA